jgi:hypothetical protein
MAPIPNLRKNPNSSRLARVPWALPAIFALAVSCGTPPAPTLVPLHPPHMRAFRADEFLRILREEGSQLATSVHEGSKVTLRLAPPPALGELFRPAAWRPGRARASGVAFLAAHGAALGLEPTAALTEADSTSAFIPADSYRFVAENPSPPRDSGCSRVTLFLDYRISVETRLPTTIVRECIPNRPAPAYAHRALPRALSGAADVVFRCGSTGGYAGPTGRLVDRFGDVYSVGNWQHGSPIPSDAIYQSTVTPPRMEWSWVELVVASHERTLDGSRGEPNAPWCEAFLPHGESVRGIALGSLSNPARGGPATTAILTWLVREGVAR